MHSVLLFQPGIINFILTTTSVLQDLLYLSEVQIRDLGLKNSAHRAKVVSSLRILKEKYERTRGGKLMLCLTLLPNDKILDVNKFKALADDKINVAQMMIFVFDRVENIVGKGENAGHQHFLLFP